ncbi:hypothetical protein JB92DRAFT_3083535 [Gautieria morchelliformis]|nr:hypothetical protein JB92DRAFT_3083535 [Gautieria morchelliformis]
MSPGKKRTPSSDDETITTPKRLRIASFASPATTNSRSTTSPFLPKHLTRLQTIHTSLQHALSLALARSAVSPSIDTGRVPNVLDHLSLSTAMGFTVNCDINDLKRLCWLWEWNGESAPESKRPKVAVDDDDNPFLVPDAPREWTRGAMGFIITPTTHLVRSEGKRVPAYGIGIEVEMDLASGKGGGMAAVARWTAEGESRRRALEAKLRTWAKVCRSAPRDIHCSSVDRTSQLNTEATVAVLPLADLPKLPVTSKLTSLTKAFAKSSSASPPKGIASHPVSARRTPKEFVPFPVTPQTPSTSPVKSAPDLETSRTRTPHTPQTPVRQTGAVPQTPTTSRRAALYERIRQKSLTSTPSGQEQHNELEPVSKEKMRLLGQEELKRRCILGRLDEVAATVWALFSSPSQTSSSPLSVARKRRTMQTQEVVRALVSSATVPISAADAQESINVLVSLCPFYLKPLVIAGEDWLEMPALCFQHSSRRNSSANPRSPRPKEESGVEVLHRSPKSVTIERGGLRDVRERIRRELELND